MNVLVILSLFSIVNCLGGIGYIKAVINYNNQDNEYEPNIQQFLIIFMIIISIFGAIVIIKKWIYDAINFELPLWYKYMG